MATVPLIAEPKCRVCDADVEVFLDYGYRAPANAFVKPEDLNKPEAKFPLRYGFCPKCFLVQLIEITPPEVLFDEYPFLTGSSANMVIYYAEMARDLRQQWRPQRVLELGPNDGTLLNNFADLPHLGIEPAANIAAVARARGLTIHTGFFGEHSAEDIRQYWGGAQADLVLSTHCITHIPDLNGLFAGIRGVLAPKGVVVLEDPSLLKVVTNTELCQLYSEHVICLSVPALSNILARHNLEIIDAQPVSTHGGSMRVTAAHKGVYPRQPSVLRQVKQELILTHTDTFRQFAKHCYRHIDELRGTVLRLKDEGQRVAVYGASSKVALALALARLGPDVLEYVSDSTPAKIGCYLPETHIKIISREEAETRLPQVWLLGAWVHTKFILEQERAFTGRWLTYVPEVCFLEPRCPTTQSLVRETKTA